MKLFMHCLCSHVEVLDEQAREMVEMVEQRSALRPSHLLSRESHGFEF